jgi:thiol:disulfide interchange protein DsbD
LNYQVCKEVCINLEKKFTFLIPASAAAVAGQKEAAAVVVAVETGTVMEDALEPSLGASNMVVATPEKAWLQRPNQNSKRLWSIFCFFIRFAALLTLVFSDDSNDGKFFTKSKTKERH